MRLVTALISAVFAMVAITLVAYVVDASSKSLALATTEIGTTYTLSAGYMYTVTVDKYGFLSLSTSSGGSSTYATLVLDLPSGYAAFIQPQGRGTYLCNYVADPSVPLLQICTTFANTTDIKMPVYYAKPGTYMLQPGTWKISVVRDPHSVWMPPKEIFVVIAVTLLVAAFIWRMYR